MPTSKTSSPSATPRAKRLRGEDREAAAWVKGLRKPTVAAWGVNQATRRDPERLGRLLDAAEALREAQEQLTAGRGGAGQLRERSRQAEAAVNELTEAAREILKARGAGAGEQLVERVRETLQAVGLDEEARSLVACGRLTHELTAAGFGPASSTTPGRKVPRKEPARNERSRRRDEQRVQRARQTAEEAGDERQAAEAEVKAATRERDQAQRRLDRANRELEQARGKDKRSVERLREAEEKLSDAPSGAGG